jgi:diguanylate cyclase (GGDEF)-like protein
MPQTNNEKKESLIVVERMRKNIKEALTRKWEKFPRPSVTVSLGISSFPEDGKSSEDLIKHTDIALYRAKALGKDRSVIYSKEL